MKKKELTIIILFISFLVLPNIIFAFIKDKTDTTNYEKRLLNTKPSINIKNIETFPKAYEAYFNDHLAFKNELRKVRAKFLYDIFKIGSNESIIVGDDGWLFYNSDYLEDGNTIENYRKISAISDYEKSTIKKTLINVNQKLEEKDKKFYILVVPNRETFCSDYMPASININNKNKTTKYEDLISYLTKDNELNLIYLKDILIKERKKEETCEKYGTHWNDYGAYIGTTGLMNIIDNKFDMQSNNIKINYSKSPGGLSKMNMTPYLKENNPKITNFYPEVKISCKGKPNYKVCSSNGKKDETILFIGDSFREAMMQYVSKIYTKSIFVHRYDFLPEMINKYNPDVVVFETVERYYDSLIVTDAIAQGIND